MECDAACRTPADGAEIMSFQRRKNKRYFSGDKLGIESMLMPVAGQEAKGAGKAPREELPENRTVKSSAALASHAFQNRVCTPTRAINWLGPLDVPSGSSTPLISA